jgi:FMN phosphatase YigB (HAD superfamily)
MFVGDTIDTDIVGGNRIGMRTPAIGRPVHARTYSNDDPESQPDHHIDSLLDVVDIVVGANTSRRIA